MTERDIAFWLQGFFELLPTLDTAVNPDDLGARWSRKVRQHLALALESTPRSGFLLACRAVVDQPQALQAVVAAQFEHVIDAGATGYDPAHPPGTPRC